MMTQYFYRHQRKFWPNKLLSWNFWPWAHCFLFAKNFLVILSKNDCNNLWMIIYIYVGLTMNECFIYRIKTNSKLQSKKYQRRKKSTAQESYTKNRPEICRPNWLVQNSLWYCKNQFTNYIQSYLPIEIVLYHPSTYILDYWRSRYLVKCHVLLLTLKL